MPKLRGFAQARATIASKSKILPLSKIQAKVIGL